MVPEREEIEYGIPMIDIHSHILPALDDGVRTLEDSVNTIGELRSLGFTHIVATPHYYPGKYTPSLASIDHAMNDVRSELEKREIEVSLIRGRECYLDFELLTAKEKDSFPFEWEGNQYQLVELPPITTSQVMDLYVKTLQQANITPILAHVERYSQVIENPEIVLEYVHMGWKIQVDLMSLSDSAPPPLRETAIDVIEKNRAHLVASDVHRLSQIPKIKNAMDFVRSRWGNQKLEALCTLKP